MPRATVSLNAHSQFSPSIVQCWIESMPAFEALSMPGTPWACEVTFLPSRWASSAAAASSSIE